MTTHLAGYENQLQPAGLPTDQTSLNEPSKQLWNALFVHQDDQWLCQPVAHLVATGQVSTDSRQCACTGPQAFVALAAEQLRSAVLALP
jgi:hypothetical protein